MCLVLFLLNNYSSKSSIINLDSFLIIYVWLENWFNILNEFVSINLLLIWFVFVTIVVFSNTVYWKEKVFYLSKCVDIFVKPKMTLKMFHWFCLIRLCGFSEHQCHRVLFILTLEQGLKSDSMSPPTWLFFSIDLLSILVAEFDIIREEMLGLW